MECNNCQRKFNKQEDFLRDTAGWRKSKEGPLWFQCSCGMDLQVPSKHESTMGIENFLSEDAAKALNSVTDAEKIPYLPNSVIQLQSLLGSPDPNIKQIANIVKGDPLLAANILKIANNMKMSSRTPNITSIEHAVTYVGANTLRDLVLLAAVKSLKLETKIFSSDAFWKEALIAGSIAERLAKKQAPKVAPDEAYIAACLANIGKYIIAVLFPEIADQISSASANGDEIKNWLEVEEQFELPDHRILGQLATALWGLSNDIQNCCLNHHNVYEVLYEPSKDKDLTLLDVVSTAVQVTHYVTGEAPIANRFIINRFRKRFDLDDKQFQALVNSLKAISLTENKKGR